MRINLVYFGYCSCLVKKKIYLELIYYLVEHKEPRKPVLDSTLPRVYLGAGSKTSKDPLSR